MLRWYRPTVNQVCVTPINGPCLAARSSARWGVQHLCLGNFGVHIYRFDHLSVPLDHALDRPSQACDHVDSDWPSQPRWLWLAVTSIWLCWVYIGVIKYHQNLNYHLKDTENNEMHVRKSMANNANARYPFVKTSYTAHLQLTIQVCQWFLA